MIFDTDTQLPIAHEEAPDILHDLLLLRKMEMEYPGVLQDIQERDINAARDRLREYRNIVLSPVSSDEARDRAIESGKSLMGALEDVVFIRVQKLVQIACDSHESGHVDPGAILPREKDLLDAINAAIEGYLTREGFTPTKEGMRLSMSSVATVTT